MMSVIHRSGRLDRKRKQRLPAARQRESGAYGAAPEPDTGEHITPRQDARELAGRIEHLLEAPIAHLGCRLLEVVYRHEGRWVLRLVIDKAPVPGAPEAAVTLDDCGAVSEVAGRILDVEDPIPHPFALEVSSPGLFRPLRERRHFAQSLGKQARFTLAPGALPEHKERTLRGTIEAVEETAVRFAVAGGHLTVPLAVIRSARLDPDL
jgi:ribosome maturation factor RimP